LLLRIGTSFKICDDIQRAIAMTDNKREQDLLSQRLRQAAALTDAALEKDSGQ